jgi:hypothetical protein
LCTPPVSNCFQNPPPAPPFPQSLPLSLSNRHPPPFLSMAPRARSPGRTAAGHECSHEAGSRRTNGRSRKAGRRCHQQHGYEKAAIRPHGVGRGDVAPPAPFPWIRRVAANRSSRYDLRLSHP